MSADAVAARIVAKWHAGDVYYGKAKPRLDSPSPSLQPQGWQAEWRFKPDEYIKEKLGLSLWAGIDGATGQAEIIAHYELALRQLHERRDYERGEKKESELEYWQPGQTIQNWISIDAGHNVGKTFVLAAIVSHFFDSFVPSIGYCFAPSDEQINDLLFKEIRTQRAGKGLPGTVLDGKPRINLSANHFVRGKATNNDNNTGTERAQGQHGEYLIFVIDEAEGVPSFVYDAVRSMSSGGICIVLIARNPRTTTCEAHKVRKQANCKSFRISCLDHPNVRQDKEIVPGSVRRQYVLEMLAGCEQVDEHSPDDYTFTLPWEPAVIYKPSLEFIWRVLGIAGGNVGLRCFVPSGRYQGAVERQATTDRPHAARLGLDCQRDGDDVAPLFVRWDGAAWCAKVFQSEAGNEAETTYKYSEGVKDVALQLKRKSCGLPVGFSDWKSVCNQGITSLHVRVDAGGGFGGGPVDRLKRIQELIDAFPDFQVIEVKFGSSPRDENKYYDCITEITADAAESLKGLALPNPPPQLEADLTERKYDWRNVAKREVKKLDEKDIFRRAHSGRSPDYGDACVMACASDFLFQQKQHKWEY